MNPGWLVPTLALGGLAGFLAGYLRAMRDCRRRAEEGVERRAMW